MVSVYVKSMSRNKCRKAVNPRVAIGALLIKHILRSTDEDTIEFIKENSVFPLPFKYQRQYWIIQEVYRQQKKMYEEKSHQVRGRIVSISQPYVRPIVRGKTGSEVEFGAKISLNLVEGYSYLDRVSWDAYNESVDLKGQIESYRARFGCYPEYVIADKIYGTRDNRAYMKVRGIKYSGVPLGRRKKEFSGYLKN